MYYNGQVVWNKKLKKPVQVGSKGDGAWAWSNVRYGDTTHFIKSNKGAVSNQACGSCHDWYIPAPEFTIALPKSVSDAEKLLDMGLISPAPQSTTHCWVCGGWLSKHKTPCEGADHGIKF